MDTSNINLECKKTKFIVQQMKNSKNDNFKLDYTYFSELMNDNQECSCRICEQFNNVGDGKKQLNL
ncbi:Hypothetical protein KVN_LOCUS300 [uncultured virus]|nr:Hypothetical protein KVN_LOCUS300 [uncultured virus]